MSRETLPDLTALDEGFVTEFKLSNASGLERRDIVEKCRRSPTDRNSDHA